ncbi:hypothetical protein KVR01_009661 [Diaporthe batatas]|uniref:uncharacterized protein n=1 Tax=Diaporthe batatas TaxID=748121 RepID=UPI001D052496|nr:uncharacterized protein KVR01_009661 [Diaporthe batatas]KAG8160125.1 hypothetical protein KVR01_009661 [Diaporthe batatas]
MVAPEAKSGPKQAGVLPIRPAQAQGPTDSSRSAKSKAAAQDGIKVKVRRLPPGLAEHEFLTILGDTWRPGNGKVGWFSYHCGHIPKSASKDSTPAFAFLQVKEGDLEALDHAVQSAIWEDAKGTFNSPSLVGPPYVERSIYKKMPLAKPKKDPKEGTIDQDEDYKAFLASLAEDPTMKPDETQADAEDPGKGEADTKITIAPLAQFVKENREKKANKAKEAAAARNSKHSRQESQGTKGKGSSTAPDESRKKPKDKTSDKPKETVRILKKQAATEAAAEAAKAVAKDMKAASSSSDAASSRRAGIQGVANILKRDLGLSNGSAARKARQEVAKQEAAKKGDAEPKAKEPKGKDGGSKAPAAAEQPAQATDRPATPTAPKAQAEKSSRSGRSRRGKETKSSDSKTGGPADAPAPAPNAPVILQKKKDDSPTASADKQSSNNAKAVTKQGSSSAAPTPPTGPKAASAKGGQPGGSQKKSSNPAPAASSTRAFLKHANPSQGVTEALLKEAMQVFGGISLVEIDRRKGFAYVDFTEHAGLVKAMAASPVAVAQATVQVLERKDQGSKKAASTPSNQAQPGTTNSSNNTVAASAAQGAANLSTAPSSNADKSGNGTTSEQQQAKRSRRRGRGRGGNAGGGGGGAANSEVKAETGAGSSTPAATDAGGPGTG